MELAREWIRKHNFYNWLLQSRFSPNKSVIVIGNQPTIDIDQPFIMGLSISETEINRKLGGDRIFCVLLLEEEYWFDYSKELASFLEEWAERKKDVKKRRRHHFPTHNSAVAGVSFARLGTFSVRRATFRRRPPIIEIKRIFGALLGPRVGESKIGRRWPR